MLIRMSMIMLISFWLASCGSAEMTEQDQQAAIEVIKQFEQTQTAITYQDPASFTAGDQYLTEEFAKRYHGELRAGMEQFIKDSKASVSSGSEPSITFMKQEDSQLLFDFKAERLITIEGTDSSANSNVHYVVTVTKQKDGSFLISNMEEVK